MKKMSLLLLSMFLGLVSMSAASYENLYIVGNGCDAGWDPDKAMELTNEGNGYFSWTGVLKGGDDLRFKFLVARGWDPSLTCRFDVPGHLVITSGEEVDLYVYTGGYDNAFQVPETGEYTISINLNDMKMTCTLGAPVEEKPNPDQLYIAGSGTNPEGNWDHENPIEMTKVRGGVFTWTGNLYDNAALGPDKNEFKFINTKGTWAYSITPDDDYEFIVDAEYELFFRDPADKKFKIATGGIYTIQVDLNEMIVRILEGAVEEKPDLSQLYIVGNATEAGWSNENAIGMTYVSEGVFTWTGDLSTENGNEFKFLNLPGVWSNTVNPLDGDITFQINTDYSLNYRPYESSPNDYKFLVTTAGTYTIDVNMNTMKMRITEGTTGLAGIYILPFEIIIENGSVNISSADASLIQSVKVVDLTGKKLSGKNLSTGIYILKAVYGDKEYIKKIMVK